MALEFVSTSKGLGFGEDVGPEGSVCGRKGGGSMMDWTAGSGRADIVSSEEVSGNGEQAKTFTQPYGPAKSAFA